MFSQILNMSSASLHNTINTSSLLRPYLFSILRQGGGRHAISSSLLKPTLSIPNQHNSYSTLSSKKLDQLKKNQKRLASSTTPGLLDQHPGLAQETFFAQHRPIILDEMKIELEIKTLKNYKSPEPVPFSKLVTNKAYKDYNEMGYLNSPSTSVSSEDSTSTTTTPTNPQILTAWDILDHLFAGTVDSTTPTTPTSPNSSKYTTSAAEEEDETNFEEDSSVSSSRKSNMSSSTNTTKSSQPIPLRTVCDDAYLTYLHQLGITHPASLSHLRPVKATTSSEDSKTMTTAKATFAVLEANSQAMTSTGIDDPNDEDVDMDLLFNQLAAYAKVDLHHPYAHLRHDGAMEDVETAAEDGENDDLHAASMANDSTELEDDEITTTSWELEDGVPQNLIHLAHLLGEEKDDDLNLDSMNMAEYVAAIYRRLTSPEMKSSSTTNTSSTATVEENSFKSETATSNSSTSITTTATSSAIKTNSTMSSTSTNPSTSVKPEDTPTVGSSAVILKVTTASANDLSESTTTTTTPTSQQQQCLSPVAIVPGMDGGMKEIK